MCWFSTYFLCNRVGGDLLNHSLKCSSAINQSINCAWTACKHLPADLSRYIPTSGFKQLFLMGENVVKKHVRAAVSMFCWQIRETPQASMAAHTLFREDTTWDTEATLSPVVGSQNLSCVTFGFESFAAFLHTSYTSCIQRTGSQCRQWLTWLDWTQEILILWKSFYHYMHSYANQYLNSVFFWSFFVSNSYLWLTYSIF